MTPLQTRQVKQYAITWLLMLLVPGSGTQENDGCRAPLEVCVTCSTSQKQVQRKELSANNFRYPLLELNASRRRPSRNTSPVREHSPKQLRYFASNCAGSLRRFTLLHNCKR